LELSSLESDPQVGRISSVSPLPCSSKSSNVKDITTPDVSANQHEGTIPFVCLSSRVTHSVCLVELFTLYV